MGVYFKGMEMPDNCAVCPIMNQDDCYCEVIHNKADDIWDRPNWCPAVEVLKPHGRLIDADKLERDIDHYLNSDGCYHYWTQVQRTVIEAEEE